MIRLTIPGTPVAKGRARSTRSGRHYTPEKTRRAEDSFAGRVFAQLTPEQRTPATGPLVLEVTFVMPIPASWSGKKTRDAESGATKPVSRPDLDNLLKLAKDACNSILWVDDSQVVEVYAKKTYGEPCTIICVHDA